MGWIPCFCHPAPMMSQHPRRCAAIRGSRRNEFDGVAMRERRPSLQFGSFQIGLLDASILSAERADCCAGTPSPVRRTNNHQPGTESDTAGVQRFPTCHWIAIGWCWQVAQPSSASLRARTAVTGPGGQLIACPLRGRVPTYSKSRFSRPNGHWKSRANFQRRRCRT